MTKGVYCNQVSVGGLGFESRMFVLCLHAHAFRNEWSFRSEWPFIIIHSLVWICPGFLVSRSLWIWHGSGVDLDLDLAWFPGV